MYLHNVHNIQIDFILLHDNEKQQWNINVFNMDFHVDINTCITFPIQHLIAKMGLKLHNIFDIIVFDITSI